MSLTSITAALSAAALAWIVCWRADAIGRALGLLDWPDPAGGRKFHAHVTPLVGGIAVVPATLIGALLAWRDAAGSPFVAAHLLWFAGVCGALFLTGVADDRLGLGPRLRLVFSLIVFACAALYAPDFRVSFLLFTDLPALLIPGAAGILFSIVCLVGLLNAVNMADGKNGLVISLSALWAAILWWKAPAYLDPLFAALLAALAITFAFNMRGRLFLGDGGSYGLSAILGLLAIYGYNHGFDDFGAGQLALLFVVPVLDTIRLITTRALKGHSPFRADRDHLHHHIAFRFGWPRGLLVYLSLVAAPNLAALAMPRWSETLLVFGLPVYVAVLVLTTRRSRFQPEIVPRPPGALRGRGADVTSRDAIGA